MELPVQQPALQQDAPEPGYTKVYIHEETSQARQAMSKESHSHESENSGQDISIRWANESEAPAVIFKEIMCM